MDAKGNQSPESVVREIRRKTRRKYSTEEKIRIVLEGLKGDFAINLSILSQINLSHSPGADLLDDPVVPNHGVFRQRNMGLRLIIVEMIS